MAKDLFGREVVKSSSKEQTADGYKKTKTKIVFDKNDDVVKSKVKTTRYTPTGNENGKASEYKASGTTVTKKTFEDGTNKVKSTNTRIGIMPVKKVDYNAIPFKNSDIDKFSTKFGK
jgi:hypothetical protein